MDIFSIPHTLAQRGFVGVTEIQIEDTLLFPNGNPLFSNKNEIPAFLNQFNQKPFRIAVRKSVYGNATTDDLTRLNGLTFDVTVDNQQRYGKTVEMLLAYLCVQYLSAFSASFGVHVDGSPEGGDFDCLVNFQNSLYHFESKSGSVTNITSDQLQHFLYRHDYLTPDASILFLDSTDVSEDVFRRFLGLRLHQNTTYTIDQILKCKIDGRRVFMIHPGIVVVDIASNGDILTNIRIGMRFLNRFATYDRATMSKLVEPKHLGLDGEILT